MSDRDERIDTLRSVIAAHAMTGFAVVMPQGFYDKHVTGRIPYETDSPYFFCFLGLIELSSKVIQSVGLQFPVIDFIFDEQGIETRARPIFDGFKAWSWPGAQLVGHLDWRSDSEELPLQAADFLAWRVRRKLIAEPPLHKQMSWVDRPSAFVHVFDEDDAQDFMAKVQAALARIIKP
jgi:hypothetical protein